MLKALYEKLDGKKMKLGGLAAIFTGLGLMVQKFSMDGGLSQEGLGLVWKGWLVIAAKSAIEKAGTAAKVLLIGLLLAGTGARAHAEEGVSLLDSVMGEIHLLDNLTPATFYDQTESVWLAGGTSELFQKFYFGGVLGVAKPILTDETATDAERRALFNTGLNFHAGSFLVDHVPQLKVITDGSKIMDGLLKYGTAGYWGTYDWTNKKFRYGPYVGFEMQFGNR